MHHAFLYISHCSTTTWNVQLGHYRRGRKHRFFLFFFFSSILFFFILPVLLRFVLKDFLPGVSVFSQNAASSPLVPEIEIIELGIWQCFYTECLYKTSTYALLCLVTLGSYFFCLCVPSHRFSRPMLVSCLPSLEWKAHKPNPVLPAYFLYAVRLW